MYRKVTLLAMVALAVTLAAATVSIAAPKETRTVCQDGVTKEIPVQAKAKGATEGPCETTPPDSELALATKVCTDNYDGTIVSEDPITCRWTNPAEQSRLVDEEDGTYLIVFYSGTYDMIWDPAGDYFPLYEGTLVSYEVTRCNDPQYGQYLDPNDSRCQFPIE